MSADYTIVSLYAEIKKCRQCRLAETRINSLCGEGNLNADLMLIAQAPGENEDREGRMFIGASGKVLDELLATVNIQRGDVYMTNLIKCRLPKNRKPKTNEISSCGPYLDREIELIDPKYLATLGYYATRYIFGKYGIPIPGRTAFHEVYGNDLEIDGRRILPLQHPAAVLHNPSIKETMVKNYYKLRKFIKRQPKTSAVHLELDRDK